MATYKFGGSLFRNSGEMHTAIAEAWLSQDGYNTNTCDCMQEVLGYMSDEALAEECCDAWFRVGPIDTVDTTELVAAFADIRDNFDKHFPVLPPYQP